jgi:aminoglycoside phosphotransferase (APT) family kinase protein
MRLMSGKMHDGEVDTDPALVRHLLAAQFPRWADLPIERVPSAGTDNALYRLGDDLVMRLPRVQGATEQAVKERAWLPRLAPRLPLAIPVPLALGEPGEGYPWRWSICPWLAGEDATIDSMGSSPHAAVDLAGFIATLRQIDATGGPPPGDHNFGRGAPLLSRDQAVRGALAALASLGDEADDLDLAAAKAAWEEALAAPVWSGTPTWIHGDLQPGNLLVHWGRLSAVIDFGALGVGDPACDLMVAWNLFTGEARAAFRAGLGADDASWARGRGWALSMALIALPYYLNTNPTIVAASRHTITEVLTTL